MTNDRPSPPPLYERLFEWFCKENAFDELQGDLEEEFQQNYRKHGIKTANKLYKREVIRMMRPSVIKKLKSNRQSNFSSMFRNYTIVAFRSIARNRLFSSINIFGLAISMAVGLLAISFLSEVYSYDKFHENRDRLYRIVTDLHRQNGAIANYATASIYTGTRLATDFTGFEAVAPITKGLRGNIAVGESSIPINGIYTNNDFFKVFSFELLSGDPSKVLLEPNEVILTETTARKIFNRIDVVGEVIRFENGTQYKITGIAKDPPNYSHLKFEAIGSLITLQEKNRSVTTDFGVIWSSYVYVLLPEGYSLDQVQQNLDRLAEEENPKLVYWTLSMGLQNIDDIFPGDGRYNQFSVVMPKEKVTSVVILALIVLFSACFNYTNLSLARSLKRAKEVGVRKVVGARKGNLFFQFILEAIMVSLVSVVISFLLFNVVKSEFLSLDLYIERTLTLDVSTQVYFYFIIFAIAIGFLAGLFPSLIMTRFKPVNILKGASSIKTGNGVGIRKVLVAIQFALSMGFATLVVMAYKQYNYALNFDLGFETENILNVDLQFNDVDLVKNQFSRIPEVTGISSSSILASTGSSQSNWVKYKDRLDSVNSYTFDVDYSYFKNMGHELVAGTGFDEGNDQGKIVVTELLVKELGINSPFEAIGETISYFQKNWTIIGVVKDFHYGTINDEISPFVFTSGRQDHYNINLKISSTNIVETMRSLDEAWRQVDQANAFQAKFYDEWFELTYQEISASMKIFSFLAGIAICISILGLLGMAVYTAESRVKELAIRKVLGATLSNLLVLLSRNFIVIFIISALVAIPAAYYLYQETIVADAIYSIELGFWEFGSGALLIIIIALLTISSQTMKAARSNPAESLRNE